MKKILTACAIMGLVIGSFAWNNAAAGNYVIHTDVSASDTTPKKDTSWKQKKGGGHHKKDSTTVNR